MLLFNDITAINVKVIINVLVIIIVIVHYN
jgi:hypothetical protein